MGKRIFLTAALVLLFFGSALAGSVSRSFSSSTVQPGADLTVTLTTTIDEGEDYYAIDERVPSGWTMKNAGTGGTEQAGHIKWLVLENAANKEYTYTLTAPSQAGATTFNGTCMMEGMAGEIQIVGQNQVSIVTTAGLADFPLPLTVLAIIIVIIAVAVIAVKKKK